MPKIPSYNALPQNPYASNRLDYRISRRGNPSRGKGVRQLLLSVLLEALTRPRCLFSRLPSLAWLWIDYKVYMDRHSRDGRYPMYRDHMAVYSYWCKETDTIVENKACVPVFPDDHILPYQICCSGYNLEYLLHLSTGT